MSRLRLLLIPFGAVAELCVLATCWFLALVGARTKARRLHDWATNTLLDLDWYTGERASRGRGDASQ